MGHGSGLNRCPGAHVSPSALRREPEPVLLWQRRGRQSESNALADAYKVAPLRSRADLIVEMVRRLLGPSAVVSDAGDHEPDGWVWRVAVAGPLRHEHLEARGRWRTVVTRPVRAARLHVRVLDVLPHGWYRHHDASCRWREPRKATGACEAVFLCKSFQGCVPCHSLILPPASGCRLYHPASLQKRPDVPAPLLCTPRSERHRQNFATTALYAAQREYESEKVLSPKGAKSTYV